MWVLSKLVPSGGHLLGCTREHTPCEACQKKVYLIAIGLGLFGAAAEYWGSKESGSIALLSDSLHLLFDTGVYVIGLLSLGAHQPYKGYLKPVLALLMALTGIYILVHASGRLTGGHSGLEELLILLLVSIAGFLVNLITLWLLHSVGAEHGDGHDHGRGHTEHAHIRRKVRGGAIRHTIGDTFGSAWVIIITLFATAFPQMITVASFLDILGAALIALYLFWAAYKLLGR